MDGTAEFTQGRRSSFFFLNFPIILSAKKNLIEFKKNGWIFCPTESGVGQM